MEDILKVYNTLAIVGKPGSGKGTQSQKLQKATGFEKFSSGHRFREIAAQDTVLGERVANVMNHGGLMPHWFASFVFQEKALHTPGDQGIIFDGVARKRPEALLFDEVMKWLERNYVVIFLNITDDSVVERTARRKNTQNRADDNEEAVRHRIEQYEKEVEPAIEVFREKGVLIDVDGEKHVDEVFEEIWEKLKVKANEQL